jgi:hypothetical protein
MRAIKQLQGLTLAFCGQAKAHPGTRYVAIIPKMRRPDKPNHHILGLARAMRMSDHHE